MAHPALKKLIRSPQSRQKTDTQAWNASLLLQPRHERETYRRVYNCAWNKSISCFNCGTACSSLITIRSLAFARSLLHVCIENKTHAHATRKTKCRLVVLNTAARTSRMPIEMRRSIQRPAADNLFHPRLWRFRCNRRFCFQHKNSVRPIKCAARMSSGAIWLREVPNRIIFVINRYMYAIWCSFNLRNRTEFTVRP